MQRFNKNWTLTVLKLWRRGSQELRHALGSIRHGRGRPSDVRETGRLRYSRHDRPARESGWETEEAVHYVRGRGGLNGGG